MATANTALRIAELDFDSIKTNLKDYLRNQSEFSDYDFEGSGLSVLLDILAYNTHYMGYYLNMVGNEMFLDTAQIRASVLSHAKHLGYLPKSKTGSTATVNIKVTPTNSEDNVSTTLVLGRNVRFISEPIDGISYVFSTTEANTAVKANNSFDFNSIQLKQGEPVIQQYSARSNRKYNIPSANVDISTIRVTVQESSTNTSTQTYTLNEDITEVTSNSAVYFLEENSDANGSYTVYFGDGIIGKKPANNNIVILNYLITSGEASNKANSFTLIDSISGYTGNVIVTPVAAAAAGSEKESVESIRFKAPYYYTTQNRAVTTEDFKTLILKDYPNIDAVSVWPGDQNDPPIYGKVFVSLKPKDDYFLTILEKERIENEIIANRSVLTVFPEIVDPDYTYLQVNALVNYHPEQTTLSQAELKQLIRQSILDYRDSDLKTFSSTFRISKLQKYIDNSHPSILGSTATIFAQKRVEFFPLQTKSYTINFGFPLSRGIIENKFYIFPSYTALDSAGTPREVYIEDTPNSITGVDSVDIVDGGFGYEVAPTITITGDGTGATATATVLNGRITNVSMTNKGADYTVANITVTSEIGAGAVLQPILEAKLGRLRVFYYKSNGEKVIINSNVGEIDYNTGIITINGITPQSVNSSRYIENYISFNAVPLNSLITPLRNNILDIDENDDSSINITLVPET